MISYFILRCAPQQERKLWEKLMAMGYHSFVPLETKHVRRHDERGHPIGHTRKREYPMFIRYGFIGCDDIYDAWHRLRADADIYPKMVQGRGPLAMPGADKPHELPAHDVAHLLALSGELVPYGTSVNPHRATLAVKEGSKARVLVGPFAGHEAPVVRIAAKRAHILLSVFNTMKEVPIPLDNLEAIG